MALSTPLPTEDLTRVRGLDGPAGDDRPSPGSAISWGAIIAGAAAAASLSLILLILGVGLGMSSVSPWARDGISATTFGVSTIVWLTLTQLVASAVGGYLAGRLRTRWIGVHTDEVYFRDTAHGFLAWAVSALATAALLTSVIGSIVGTGVQAGASVVAGVATTAGAAVGAVSASADDNAGNDKGPMGYFVDALFRRAAAGPAPAATDAAGDRGTADEVAEVGRIFMNVSLTGPLPADDLRYVGQIVARRTGLTPQAAEARVAEVYARAQAQARAAEQATREAADQARKVSAYSALWLFVSLLIGAFVASLAATLGGRRRDA